MEDTIKEELGGRASFGSDGFIQKWCGMCGSKLINMRRVVEGKLGGWGSNCPNPGCCMHVNTPDNWQEV